MTERRTARRYDLSLPVTIRLLDEKDAVSCTGNTRDISTRGVYFTIDDDLRIGAGLDLKLTVAVQVSCGTEAFIRATGKIVRLDKIVGKGDGPVGVAAVIQQHEIVRNEPAF